MKKVYFVRHGQVQSNIDNTGQDSSEKLTELGLKQAEFVAKRIKKLGVETILSSSYDRALQTAEVIEHESSAGIVISDLFIEVVQPREYIGRSIHDPEIRENMKLRKKNMNDPHWKYSNEETFFEMLERAKKAIKMIESREEEVVCVVTHGEFLRLLIAVLAFGNDLKSEDWIHFRSFMKTTNTGITYCIYDSESKEERKWKLISWNDHAHLG